MGLDFDSANNQRITYSVGSDLDNLTAITVAMACKPLGGSGTRDMISHWRFAATKDLSWLLARRATPDWFWEVAYDDTNNTDNISVSGTAGPANDVDSVVVGRWKTDTIALDARTYALTVNTGTNSSAISRSSISDAASTTDLVIASQDDPGNYFDGIIYYAAIWDSYLSNSQVESLLARVHPIRVRMSNLKFILDLWNTSFINDYGPASYNGTIAGTGNPAVVDHWAISPPLLGVADYPRFGLASGIPTGPPPLNTLLQMGLGR